MDKEKKSARELADMIALRMRVAAGLVSIHRDATRGWAANVFTGPSQMFGDQALAEQIAADARETRVAKQISPHFFGKFLSQAEAEKWIDEHRWLQSWEELTDMTASPKLTPPT